MTDPDFGRCPREEGAQILPLFNPGSGGTYYEQSDENRGGIEGEAFVGDLPRHSQAVG